MAYAPTARLRYNMKFIETNHGNLSLPAFLPDATRGVVRAVDSVDLVNCGIRGLMVNLLHLSSKPGTKSISDLGVWKTIAFVTYGNKQRYGVGSYDGRGEGRRDNRVLRQSLQIRG